jgi:hypothetical protein
MHIPVGSIIYLGHLSPQKFCPCEFINTLPEEHEDMQLFLLLSANAHILYADFSVIAKNEYPVSDSCLNLLNEVITSSVLNITLFSSISIMP